MAEESDGIAEALEGAVRLAVTAGARVGSEIARAREERLRDERLRDERAAAQLAQRFEAEKRVAVAELSQVHRPEWWDRADPARIGQAYATARAWASESGEAIRAEVKLRDELESRYGIDVDRIDPRAVSAEVEAWRQRLEEQRRQEIDRQRAVETAERAEATALLEQAAGEDRHGDTARDDEQRTDDQALSAADNPWLATGSPSLDEVDQMTAQAGEDHGAAARSNAATGGISEQAELLYDSAERRAADTQAMQAQGVEPGVAENRMRADTGRAKPAILATAGAGRGRAPKARKAVSRRAEAERASLER